MKPTPKDAFDVEAFLDSAVGTKKLVDYRRSATIFAQGDPSDHVLYIRNGTVKLSVLSQSGRQAVVALLGPGQFFGEGGLAGQPVRMGSATATTDCTILQIDRGQMARLLHQQHALSDVFISHMLVQTSRSRRT